MTNAAESDPHPARHLSERIRRGDLLSVARAISLVENDWPFTELLLDLLGSGRPRVPVIGFTGPPGAGKSTLIKALVELDDSDA